VKKPAKVTGKVTGQLIPQPHGGALRHGGPGGGGSGRPPSAIRELVRGSFEERFRILESIADDPDADRSDRLKAVDLLGKYGGIVAGAAMNEDDVRVRLKMTLLAVSDELSEEDAARVLARLKAIWA
jgi:hypothetical protein